MFVIVRPPQKQVWCCSVGVSSVGHFCTKTHNILASKCTDACESVSLHVWFTSATCSKRPRRWTAGPNKHPKATLVGTWQTSTCHLFDMMICWMILSSASYRALGAKWTQLLSLMWILLGLWRTHFHLFFFNFSNLNLFRIENNRWKCESAEHNEWVHPQLAQCYFPTEVCYLEEHLLGLHMENTCCLQLKVWMQSNIHYTLLHFINLLVYFYGAFVL